MITIRPETIQEYAVVEEVNRFAFGQENEARLVANLRRSPFFILDLSLVAVMNGTIVGHIMFTHIATFPVAIHHTITTNRILPGSSLIRVHIRKEAQYGIHQVNHQRQTRDR